MKKNILIFIALLSSLIGAKLQAQTISLGTITPTTYCAGGTISVPFTTTGTFGTGNTFTAQLLSISGGSTFVRATQTGTSPINLTLPSGFYQGSNFRVRVVSTNPNIQSAMSPFITIYAQPLQSQVSTTLPTIVAGSSSSIYVPYSSVNETYQLQDAITNTNIGSSVIGTGSSMNISTGNLSSTTDIRLVSTVSSTSCTRFSNVVTIRVIPFGTVDILVNNITPSYFSCAEFIYSSFTPTGIFNAANVFTVELSDENGDFTTPTSTQTSTGTINLPIPLSIPSGNGYLLRVKSSDPVSTSNQIQVIVNQPPIVYTTSASPTEVLYGTGTTISLSASQTNVDYRLQDNLTGGMYQIHYIPSVTGTGGVINFATGGLTTTTNYNVRALQNISPYCNRDNNIVTVTVYSTGNPGTGGRYATIQDAVNAATTGQTIQIIANRFYDENVIVDKNLTFTSTGTYQEVTIKSIQVNNGITLTIDGNMSVSEKLHMKVGSNITVNAGNDFVLRSTSAGTALVINEDANTTVTGNVIMERFMPSVSDLAGGFDGQAYHLFSSPFSDAKIAQFGNGIVLNTAYNTAPEPAFVRPFPTFFEYKETNGRANTSQYFNPFISNYKVPTTTDLEVARGYQANIATASLIKLNGNLNNGTISTLVTNSSGNVLDGYNLIGNPYPSPIDWEAIHSLSTGVEATIYLEIPTSQYDGRFAEYVAGTGVTNNGGKKEIAPMQGFFVRTATGGTVTMNNTVRLTTDQRFYKTTETQDTKEGLVRVALKGNNTLDETTIYFQNGATPNFDGKYDAAKIHKFNSKLSTLYSYNENTETAETNYFAINGLGSFDSNQKLPLAMNILTEGEYEITLRDIKYFHSKHQLYLYDSLTDSLHNLRTEGNYKFQSVKGNEIKRFTLLFEINANQDFFATENVVVYPNPTPNEFSYSLKTDREGDYLVRLFDATGRMILEENKLKEGAFLEGTINLEKYSTGLYLLQISDSQKTTTVRVVKE